MRAEPLKTIQSLEAGLRYAAAKATFKVAGLHRAAGRACAAAPEPAGPAPDRNSVDGDGGIRPAVSARDALSAFAATVAHVIALELTEPHPPFSTEQRGVLADFMRIAATADANAAVDAATRLGSAAMPQCMLALQVSLLKVTAFYSDNP
jgi:hypothetical protein